MHSRSRRFAIALDIDGVLIRGKQALPWTRPVLRRLEEAGVPHIFLTNGGGAPERVRALQFGETFAHPVRPEQLVLGHSAYRELVPLYGKRPVLVIGRDTCRDAALDYGFEQPILMHQFLALNPSRWPFSTPSVPPPAPLREPVAAVLLFHDSWDWGRDVQLLVDVLRGADGSPQALDHPASLERSPRPSGACTAQRVPFFSASNDFLWQNDYPLPRLAQGTLSMVASLLFKELTGNDLQVTYYGKPQPRQYAYARTILDRLNRGGEPVERIYAIGDNPESDILGANKAGWISVLVKTGVYSQGYSGDDRSPQYIFDHVGDAIQRILEMEGV